MISHKLPKAEHLRSPADFRKVYDEQCSVSDRWLIVYARANDLPHARLGLSVSRKIGIAVTRNRFRRLYREAFRLTKHELPTGLDVILIPRGQREPTLSEVQASLSTLLPRLAQRLLGERQV